MQRCAELRLNHKGRSAQRKKDYNALRYSQPVQKSFHSDESGGDALHLWIAAASFVLLYSTYLPFCRAKEIAKLILQSILSNYYFLWFLCDSNHHLLEMIRVRVVPVLLRSTY